MSHLAKDLAALNSINNSFSIRKRNRIEDWKKNPPDIEIEIGDGPKRKVGFWKREYPDNLTGLWRIEANSKGEYDPFDRIIISSDEINAIIRLNIGMD